MFGNSDAPRLHDMDQGYVKIERAALGEVSAWRVRSTGHDVDVNTDDQITVLIPKRGRVTCAIKGTTLSSSAGGLIILSPNTRQTRVEKKEDAIFEAFPLVFSLERVQNITREMGGTFQSAQKLSNFAFGGNSSKCRKSKQLIQLTNTLVDDLEPGDENLSVKSQQSWSQLLTEKLVTLLANNDVVDLPNDDDSAAAYRHVAIAEEYMREHFCEISTVSDVANVCGISVRSLELAFKAVRSQSPMARLTEVRLDYAQQLLLLGNGENSVTQVAMDSGFNHLGRFAIAYRRRFGMKPSEANRWL